MNLWSAMVEAGREVARSRALLGALIARDIRVRYKQSLLGVAWALLTPVAMMLLFTLFTRAKILKVDTGDVPYVIFAYCGILPWTFFSSSVTAASTCLTSNHHLVTKVYFPREVLPLASVLSKFVDFLVATTVLIGLMAWYRVGVGVTILLVPLVLGLQMVFTVGIALYFAMGNLFYRDVKHLIGVGMMLWMFATSVIYPVQFSNPVLNGLFTLNPMTPILNSYRAILIHNQLPDWGGLGIAASVAVLVFATAVWVFRAEQHRFAERI